MTSPALSRGWTDPLVRYVQHRRVRAGHRELEQRAAPQPGRLRGDARRRRCAPARLPVRPARPDRTFRRVPTRSTPGPTSTPIRGFSRTLPAVPQADLTALLRGRRRTVPAHPRPRPVSWRTRPWTFARSTTSTCSTCWLAAGHREPRRRRGLLPLAVPRLLRDEPRSSPRPRGSRWIPRPRVVDRDYQALVRLTSITTGGRATPGRCWPPTTSTPRSAATWPGGAAGHQHEHVVAAGHGGALSAAWTASPDMRPNYARYRRLQAITASRRATSTGRSPRRAAPRPRPGWPR